MGKSQRFTTRKEIRHKLAELLCNETKAGKNVFPNRVKPIKDTELPYILIYPKDEDLIRLQKVASNNIGSVVRRDLEIIVQVVAEDSNEKTMSDLIDDIVEQVENRIDLSNDLGGLVHDINLGGGEADLSGEGHKPSGSWAMLYHVTYIKKPTGG